MEKFDYFVSSVYKDYKPEYLKTVSNIAEEYIDTNLSKTNTKQFYGDYRLNQFTTYVAQTSWDILNSQGFGMNNYQTYFLEMWMQIHHKYSFMAQHVHPLGCQIVGLYFLETPADGCKILFHDPRLGKNQINLPEKDKSMLTFATETVYFEPVPGTILFTNAWLAHSLTPNYNDKETRLVHFNLGVKPYIPPPPPAEVI
jgi:uncharacterized protein (TIGR02466 family)